MTKQQNSMIDLGECLRKQVYTQAWSQAKNHVYGHILGPAWSQVRWSISRQVNNQVYEQSRKHIWVQLNNLYKGE